MIEQQHQVENRRKKCEPEREGGRGGGQIDN